MHSHVQSTPLHSSDDRLMSDLVELKTIVLEFDDVIVEL
jgi:hypothetical protein